MGEGPRVAFLGGRTRFFDSAGGVFTIYDCARVGNRIRRVALAARMATWRVFVDPSGKRFAYRFTPRDSRELDPELLARQLRNARWSSTFRPTRRARR